MINNLIYYKMGLIAEAYRQKHNDRLEILCKGSDEDFIYFYPFSEDNIISISTIVLGELNQDKRPIDAYHATKINSMWDNNCDAIVFESRTQFPAVIIRTEMVFDHIRCGYQIAFECWSDKFREIFFYTGRNNNHALLNENTARLIETPCPNSQFIKSMTHAQHIHFRKPLAWVSRLMQWAR